VLDLWLRQISRLWNASLKKPCRKFVRFCFLKSNVKRRLNRKWKWLHKIRGCIAYNTKSLPNVIKGLNSLQLFSHFIITCIGALYALSWMLMLPIEATGYRVNNGHQVLKLANPLFNRIATDTTHMILRLFTFAYIFKSLPSMLREGRGFNVSLLSFNINTKSIFKPSVSAK